MTATALIICIGNTLVGDDGIGPAVYHELSGRVLPENTRLRLLGLGGMSLLEELAGEDLLIIVDAVQFGAEPGTVHVLDWENLPQSETHVSCHGIGVREAIEVSRRLYPKKTPAQVCLIGIEGKCFDRLGEGLSAEVAVSVETAAARILEIIEKLTRNPADSPAFS